ncbi:MAG: 16S rRNA (cytosine(967)-C(5))-methyltransferase RsmB, partial [Clostridia bacterium]|nr:16S rRNA (cytosine(967)-C(5))-methyltransferase RsmB [Clostridia bacterium]
LPEENEQVLEAFLRSHSDYKLRSFLLRGIERPGSVTLYPHRDGTDGFFISKLERSAHRCRN